MCMSFLWFLLNFLPISLMQLLSTDFGLFFYNSPFSLVFVTSSDSLNSLYNSSPTSYVLTFFFFAFGLISSPTGLFQGTVGITHRTSLTTWIWKSVGFGSRSDSYRNSVIFYWTFPHL
jgi:hypothetical protein